MSDTSTGTAEITDDMLDGDELEDVAPAERPVALEAVDIPRGISESVALRAMAAVFIPVAKLVPSENNPRSWAGNHDDLSDLAASIRAIGMVQPIVVRPVGGGDRYEIVAGGRRYQAGRLIGLLEYPAIIREGLSDDEALAIALEENTNRRELTPIDIARGYANLAKSNGLTQVELAAKYGISQGYISKYQSLLRLPDGEIERIAEGQLSPSHGFLLATIADYPVGLSAFATRAYAESWPLTRLEDAIREFRAADEKRNTTAPLFDAAELAAASNSGAEAEPDTSEQSPAYSMPPSVGPGTAGSAPTPAAPRSTASVGTPPSNPPAAAPPAVTGPSTPAPSRPPIPGTSGPAGAPPVAAASPQPVAPTEAVSTATVEDLTLATPAGARVATDISVDDDDWLYEAGLTLDQALASLRRQWPYRLDSLSIKCVKALTDDHNAKFPDAPVSPAQKLASVIVMRADDAGLDIDTLKSLPE